MFLRRAIQLSVVLIYWVILVPLVREQLISARWIRRGRWTIKRFGFYGIAAFIFIFVYISTMLLYVWYKRCQKQLLDEINQTAAQATAAVEVVTPPEPRPPEPPKKIESRVLQAKRELEEKAKLGELKPKPTFTHMAHMQHLEIRMANERMAANPIDNTEYQRELRDSVREKANKLAHLHCWRYPHTSHLKGVIDLSVKKDVDKT